VNLMDHLRRQLIYEEWANREVLEAMGDGGEADARPLQLMAHIVGAARLWLERLNQQPQSVPVWPDFGREESEAQAAEVSQLWREYLESISDSDLSRTVSYKNSKGEAWSSTVIDVVTHVLLHSAYHRGQIASQMRASGRTPAYTDFIHAVRQGLID
jgi:uncharacterized damage-inducible protein DinB